MPLRPSGPQRRDPTPRRRNVGGFRIVDLSASIHLLGETLGEVLRTQESVALFETEERDPRPGQGAARAETPGAADEPGRRGRGAVRRRRPGHRLRVRRLFRPREPGRGGPPHPGLARARAGPAPGADRRVGGRGRGRAPRRAGSRRERMAALLEALRVELVLTAHPTEAKRRTVLSKLQRIGETLRRLHDADLLPRERDAAIAVAARRGHRAVAHRPQSHRAPGRDRRGAHGTLLRRRRVLGGAAPDRRRPRRGARASTIRTSPRRPRWLTLASWVGGDRDGNPSVVTPVTAETLRLHRGLAVERHRRSLQDLARRLSVSGRRRPPPPALAAWLEARRPLPPARGLPRGALRERALPARAGPRRRRPRGGLARRHDGPSPRRGAAPGAGRPPTKSRRSWTSSRGPCPRRWPRTSCATCAPSSRPSGSTRRAWTSARTRAGWPAPSGASCGRSRSIATLRARDDRAARALRAAPPGRRAPEAADLAAAAATAGEAGAEIWRLFRLLARAQSVYGRALLGPFIISMTRGTADVLSVLLLARWAGCACRPPDRAPLRDPRRPRRRARASSPTSSRSTPTALTWRAARASRW